MYILGSIAPTGNFVALDEKIVDFLGLEILNFIAKYIAIPAHPKTSMYVKTRPMSIIIF